MKCKQFTKECAYMYIVSRMQCMYMYMYYVHLTIYKVFTCIYMLRPQYVCILCNMCVYYDYEF